MNKVKKDRLSKDWRLKSERQKMPSAARTKRVHCKSATFSAEAHSLQKRSEWVFTLIVTNEIRLADLIKKEKQINLSRKGQSERQCEAFRRNSEEGKVRKLAPSRDKKTKTKKKWTTTDKLLRQKARQNALGKRRIFCGRRARANGYDKGELLLLLMRWLKFFRLCRSTCPPHHRLKLLMRGGKD